MVKQLDMELKLIQTNVFLQVNGIKVKLLVVNVNTQMDHNMSVNGKMESQVERVKCIGQLIRKLMKVNSLQVNLLEMV